VSVGEALCAGAKDCPIDLKLTNLGRRALIPEDPQMKGVCMLVSLTNESLTRERNLFLVGFFVLVVIGLIFRVGFTLSPLEGVSEVAALLTLIAKGVLTYLVFRLSRFLRQPGWLTAIYCILAPFGVLYLIPLIGLLVGVSKARASLKLKTGSRGGT
jgi:hypothetical protein